MEWISLEDLFERERSIYVTNSNKTKSNKLNQMDVERI